MTSTIALSLLILAQSDLPQWETQTSGTTARLRGVSAVNDRVAWASGVAGTILRTSDGGHTWQRLTIPGSSALDFRDVDALNERTAYVLSIGPGDASRIYRTTDAGANWQLQFTNPDPRAFYDALHFTSPSHGLALSDSVDNRFILLATQNGGARWALLGNLPPALPGEGAFAASGSNIAAHKRHRWVGTGAGRVLYSHDAGGNWRIAVTGLASSATAGIFSIAFRDQRHGLVVGGDYKRETEAVDNAAITADGGVTWQLVRGLSGFRSAVIPLAGKSWLAVGPSGTDLSRDDGRTWQPLSTTGFHALSKAGRTVWAVGEGGRIGRLRWR